MQIILCFLVAFSFAVSAEDNYLIGKWEFDGARTLSGLELTKAVPDRFLEYYRTGRLPADVTYIFTDSTWWLEFPSGFVGDRTKYEVSEIREDNGVVIIEIVDGEEGSIQEYFFPNRNLCYGFAQHNGFVYKEYLRRVE